MRERVLILFGLIFVVALLIGLNAVSYVQIEREPDSEGKANRSTYNAGATGTKAFYEFLRESGRQVVRWQERPSTLSAKNASTPKTLIIIGKPRRRIEESEAKSILAWTATGNKLVIIDRESNGALLPKSGNWQIEVTDLSATEFSSASSENVSEMTKGVTAAKPNQPTTLTTGVDSVMTSKFATSITLQAVQNESLPTIAKPTPKPTSSKQIANSDEDEDEEYYDDEPPPPPMPMQTPKPTPKPTPSKQTSNYNDDDYYGEDDAPPPPPKPTPIFKKLEKGVGSGSGSGPTKTQNFSFFAPVVHLTSKEKNIVADFRYGAGRIIVVTDPYIVSNGGIQLVDNLQLMTNIVGSDGLIAFDEFHQGYGAEGNAWLNYFEGTPIPAIVAQLALITLLLIYTNGKRFGRPLPLPFVDRRSKLEYVAAMAELQQRTKLYDLAIETIYGRFRRNLAKYAGVDNLTTSRDVLAAKVAERSKVDKTELVNLMTECEDVIHGEPLNSKKALSLVGKIREIETALNIKK